MANLNLNLDLFTYSIHHEDYLGAHIYSLTAVNRENERETLGYFTSEVKAKEELDFWTNTMGYTDAIIHTHLLRF